MERPRHYDCAELRNVDGQIHLLIISVILGQVSCTGSSSFYNGAALDEISESVFGDLKDVDEEIEWETLEPTFNAERVSQFSSRAQGT